MNRTEHRFAISSRSVQSISATTQNAFVWRQCYLETSRQRVVPATISLGTQVQSEAEVIEHTTCTPHDIHMTPCARVPCAQATRVFRLCVLWCMWSLFRAWNSGASESRGRGWQNAAPPNPEGRHVLTAKRPHTPAHHVPLFRRPSEGRSTEDPGSPLL